MVVNKRNAFFVVLTMVCVLPGTAQAIMVVDDDLDDGALDPAWSVAFQDADGWSYTETGTELVVDDISATVINSGSFGPYAGVVLARTFSALTDFHVDFDISWDSEDDVTAMQRLSIALYDSQGGLICRAEYHDSWIDFRGGEIG